jgi:DNA-binding MarR family transcriptional regulator
VSVETSNRAGSGGRVERGGARADAVSDLLGVLDPLRRLLRRAVRHRAPITPLPGAQAEVLRVVDERPGLGVRDTAAVLHLAANSVSTLVNQLVASGLLERGEDPTDRRNARLHLTPQAERRLEVWGDHRREVMGRALAELGAGERDRIDAALPAFRHLIAALERHA